MVKLAVALFFVLGVATLNVVRGEDDGAELYKKFRGNVRVYQEQCENIVEPIWDKLRDKLAVERREPGNSAVSNERSFFGTMVQCSKAFALSISEPSYALLGAGVYLYAHVRAYLSGIIDCFRTNGFFAPVALPVCFVKYSSYAITDAAKSQSKMLQKAFESFMDTVTLEWLKEC